MKYNDASDIYILFSCNEWKEHSSMRLIAATIDINTLYSVIGNEIVEGRINYRGETKKAGFRDFKQDFDLNNINFNFLEYGFVNQTENLNVKEMSTANEYSDIFNMLHMSDGEIDNVFHSLSIIDEKNKTVEYDIDSEITREKDNLLYSLVTTKEELGDDYSFHQSMTIDEIKKTLETGDMESNDNVANMLENGNLDIELIINFDEYDGNGREKPTTLEYFCCVRKNGEWQSYDEIPIEVNINAPNIETEMFYVLRKYAEKEGLSFFGQNKSIDEKYSCYINTNTIDDIAEDLEP